ncbi:DUF6090 family protein [uncultured Flavobacterium sp.]|uniref:DUF6090 family protein n=1 Tax=uncultured Flavobacterium sp. TaxID=165435 RepID=UPI0030EB7E91|tara:strand:+ start:69731 stop:70447 length:717 start_codon:yes stop_codon:yes gene_type:complete
MIKFFRKIRKNMLSERKTGKYLKYAIGEIVLVVIGILIALQINNWNEHRKQNETLQGIYQIIKEDIATDIVEIDAFVDDYEKIRKPAFEAVLNGNLTKEDLQKHPEYLSVLDGYKDFAINQRGFELLKNQSNDMRIGNQNLTSKINLFYNKHLIEINIAAIEIMREFVYNLNEHKKSAWFSSFLLHKETKGVIDFMMNNPLEKNRITSYYMAYKIYVQEIQEFKKNGEEIIKQIDAIN